MLQRDWVTVGLRLLGAWLCLSALDDYRALVEIYLGWFTPLHTPIELYWLLAVMHTLVGLFLFSFAHQVVGLVYRQPRGSGEENQAGGGASQGVGGGGGSDL